MYEMNKRSLLKALALSGVLLIPYNTSANNLDPNTVAVANWAKNGGQVHQETKYNIDGRLQEPIGEIEYYTREVEIDGKKWCITYADKGPILPETGKFSPDKIPNEYDNLNLKRCDKPFTQMPIGDMEDFFDLGLDGEIDYGSKALSNFQSPQRKQQQIRQVDPKDRYREIKEKENAQIIKKNKDLYDAAQSHYRTLTQRILESK